MTQKTQLAIVGGECFWCTEAVFTELRGVVLVMPGYAGGQMPNPTYEQVCGGETGHAEVIKIEFDPSQITYDDLLTVFFATHDPTTLNRQGNDIGTQYRSIILYTIPEQKKEAEVFITELNKEGGSVVTEVKPFEQFYHAEEEHREYFKKNPDKAYCQLVISPKLEKLRQKFEKLLK
jgi:peptide-methionine (S)-S-oxide reductase